MIEHFKQHSIPYLITGALTLTVGWFAWSFDHLVDDRISAFYDNKGVPKTDVENIRGQIDTINAKLDDIAERHEDMRTDLCEVREDFRTLVRAL